MTLPELDGVLSALGKLLPGRRQQRGRQGATTTQYKSLRQRPRAPKT